MGVLFYVEQSLNNQMFYLEPYNLKLGNLGEKIAQKYIIGLGYVLIAKKARFSHKEVDLIVQKGQEIRFIEVKTCCFNKKMPNISSKYYISSHKIYLLKQVIAEFCLILDKKEENLYLDLIAVTIISNKMANISYFRNIF